VAGWEYAISATGTRDIGSGSVTYAQGGFVVYNGATWDYIPPVTGVTSINGSLTGAVTGVVTTADTGTVTNTMLAGSIANVKLVNSSVTIGSTAVALGATVTAFAGLTSVTSTSFVGALAGNATTVTNGVYTTDTGTVTNAMLAGSIANAKLANSSITVTAGTGMSGGGAVSLGGTVTLTNTGVTSASAGTGISVSASTGAVTITNTGVTSLIASTYLNVNSGTGAVTVSTNATSLNTVSTLVARDSSGNFAANSVTANRVFLGNRTVTGGTALTVDFSADAIVLWSVPTGNGTITLANYTAGATVKVIIRLTTARNFTLGVAAVQNTTTGAQGNTTITGTGGGAMYGANQAVILTYICVDGTATNTYVAVDYV
jgi:hypothetical protein